MSSNTCSIVDLVKLITRPAAVMNMISHSHAYSLYPKETFDNMRSLVVRSHDSRPKMVQALEKYKQRGWDVVTSISVEEASDSKHLADDTVSLAILRRGCTRCLTSRASSLHCSFAPG